MDGMEFSFDKCEPANVLHTNTPSFLILDAVGGIVHLNHQGFQP